MSLDDFRERAALIARVPPELQEYQRWLDGQRSSAGAERDYLFAEPLPRFEPRRGDVVVPIPGLEVIGRKKESALRFAAAGVDIALPGVSARTSHGEDAMQCSRNVTARQTDSTPLCSRQSKSKSKSKSSGGASTITSTSTSTGTSILRG